MFAFFGQFGGKEINWFNSLSLSFEKIDGKLHIKYFKDPNHLSAIGQSANSFFYPLHEPYIDNQSHRIYALQGYLWRKQRFPDNSIDALASLMDAGKELLDHGELRLDDDSGGIYILASADLNLGLLRITCDYSGLIPLYYSKTSDGALLFSTHIRPLARVLSAEKDESGIIHHASFHHTIGNRTLFKGIFRLNPGETLTYNSSEKKLSFTQAIGFYKKLDSYKSDFEAADALWADYLSGMIPLSKIEGTKGILLSGGFDTRLVVTGFRHYANNIAAVTFGDLENFEVRIAQQISKLAQAEQEIMTPIQDHNLAEESINELINKVEFVNFPYCDTSALILKRISAVSASTGYGGESFLGGQAYSLLGPELTQRDRLTLGLKRSIGLPIDFEKRYKNQDVTQTIQRIRNYYERPLLHNRKIFSPSWQELIDKAILDLRIDITNEVNRILINQPETILQILERFWIEHHVLKHFSRQELTLMASMPVLLPTVHHTFLRRCSNLHPSHKLDHGIYLKLVKRHFAEFAKFPTANIPVALTNPELILWLTRSWRSHSDKKYINNMISKKGNVSGNRFGWSNFEIWLRMSKYLENCPKYISFDLFSKNYIQEKITRIQNWDDRLYSGQDFLTFITISQNLIL